MSCEDHRTCLTYPGLPNHFACQGWFTITARRCPQISSIACRILPTSCPLMQTLGIWHVGPGSVSQLAVFFDIFFMIFWIWCVVRYGILIFIDTISIPFVTGCTCWDSNSNVGGWVENGGPWNPGVTCRFVSFVVSRKYCRIQTLRVLRVYRKAWGPWMRGTLNITKHKKTSWIWSLYDA